MTLHRKICPRCCGKVVREYFEDDITGKYYEDNCKDCGESA